MLRLGGNTGAAGAGVSTTGVSTTGVSTAGAATSGVAGAAGRLAMVSLHSLVPPAERPPGGWGASPHPTPELYHATDGLSSVSRRTVGGTPRAKREGEAKQADQRQGPRPQPLVRRGPRAKDPGTSLATGFSLPQMHIRIY